MDEFRNLCNRIFFYGMKDDILVVRLDLCFKVTSTSEEKGFQLVRKTRVCY